MGESASVSCNFAASRQSSEPTSPLPSLGTMDAANNIETGSSPLQSLGTMEASTSNPPTPDPMDAANNIETELGECIDVQMSNEIEEHESMVPAAPPITDDDREALSIQIDSLTDSLTARLSWCEKYTRECNSHTQYCSKPTPSLPSLGPMDAANNTSTDSSPLQSLGTMEASTSNPPTPDPMDAANNIETELGECIDVQMSNEIEEHESMVPAAPPITGDDREALSIQMDYLTDTLTSKLSWLEKNSRELDEPVLGIIPDVIRANHWKEYAPQIIAIGPYHNRHPTRLEPMEDMKLQFLSDLCRRVARNRSMTEENVLRNITTAVQMRGVEVKKKYSQPLNRKMPSLGIVEMLVLDGCFIVELLVKRQKNELLKALPMTFQNNILDSVVRDLLLYENQIPFFILEEIYGACFHATATDMSNSQSIRSLAINFFRYEKEFRDQEIVHHLLHLCHMNMVSEQNPRADQDNCTTIFCSFIKTIFNSLVMFMIFILLSPAILLFGFLFLIRSWWKYCLNQNKYVAPIERKKIPTATELDKYGVQFRTKQIDGNASFIDVSFKDGIMVIPHTRIEDPTSSTYRNLLALEQSWSEYGNKFTSYVAFMDDLIDTADDVALLRKKMILVNCLGSDEEVAKIFNEMCLELSVNPSKGYLVDMYGEINKYCDGTYNKWRATLMRDYLNSPWSIISVLAVSFVIFLAVVQTVCSIIQVKTGK